MFTKSIGTAPHLPCSVCTVYRRQGGRDARTIHWRPGRPQVNVATDETDRLIASNKVEGTAVYNHQGERLGEVYNFMVDKRSGQVSYAVLSFGGFMSMGGNYHPLPWKALTYDTNQGGYVIDIDKDRPDWSDPSYGRRIDDYYGPFPSI